MTSIASSLRRIALRSAACAAAGLLLSGLASTRPLAESRAPRPQAAAPVARPAVPQVAPATTSSSCTGDPVVRTWRQPGASTLGTKQAVTIQLIAATRHACKATKVKVTISTTYFDDTVSMQKYLTRDDKDYWGVTYTVAPSSVYNAEAGHWGTSYAVTRASGSYTHDSRTFTIRRAATLTTDATPEPIGTGHTLTVEGSLKRADWENAKYVGYAGVRVELQRRTGGGSFTTAGHATSNDDGALSTTITAEADSCYRYRYGGSSRTAQVTSKPDCVTVTG